MSRTTLVVLTAAVLASLSLGVLLLRLEVMGNPSVLAAASSGTGNYKVTMLVRGKSTGDARVFTACALDVGRQHVYAEAYTSSELFPRMVETQNGARRALHWTQRVGVAHGPVEARYEFYCKIDVARPSTSMTKLHQVLYARPKAGEYLAGTPGIDPSSPEVTRLALRLTSGLQNRADQTRALFQYVHQDIHKDPGTGGPSASALECLRRGRGDALARSRLLIALCRNRGIPARTITGLMLTRRHEQTAHAWVEAWIDDYWMPMCPFNGFCGKIPHTYLVFGVGDMVMVRGHNVRDLDYACLVEHVTRDEEHAAGGADPTRAQGWRPRLERFFTRVSLYSLPPAEQRLSEFLLLLPLAALIICLFRNVIGLQSFGTFAPALIGLAFRSTDRLPGIIVFVSIVLVGWSMRRLLDRYHLLQVPRTAFLLSLVVLILISAIMAANFNDLAATRYVSLFPLVILTGMIERFWTLEAEDGTVASFKTLLSTMLIAACISLSVSIPAVVSHMVTFPETLGLIMAFQLLLGRYTGYRLLELFRFRDFVPQSIVR